MTTSNSSRMLATAAVYSHCHCHSSSSLNEFIAWLSSSHGNPPHCNGAQTESSVEVHALAMHSNLVHDKRTI